MIFSLALILIVGLLLGNLFNKFKLPSLIGMLLTGIILGPYALNLVDANILLIATDLRQIALVIIIIRAGLSLNIKSLFEIGKEAILMCFVPAMVEIIAMTLIAPMLLKISYLEAALLGTVIAAVSPAVIVPRMIKLYDEGYGNDKNIAQLILTGASVDDIFVIILFTVFLNIVSTSSVNVLSFIRIPTSIVLGIGTGVILGLILTVFFRRFHIRDTIKVLILLSVSFILVTIENYFNGYIAFSGLLAILSASILLNNRNKKLTMRLSKKFSKLWVFAEIILFVLVGTSVNINYALQAGVSAILVVAIVSIIRMIGVYICLIRSRLNHKEKLFCMFAYLPKATVQAAIGSIPLAQGLECGPIILTVSVVAILITAPVGATLIDNTYKKLLNNQ